MVIMLHNNTKAGFTICKRLSVASRASRRVVQIQIVNGLRDATFDGRGATRPNRTKFYLSVESEAVHVASEVAPSFRPITANYKCTCGFRGQ